MPGLMLSIPQQLVCAVAFLDRESLETFRYNNIDGGVGSLLPPTYDAYFAMGGEDPSNTMVFALYKDNVELMLRLLSRGVSVDAAYGYYHLSLLDLCMGFDASMCYAYLTTHLHQDASRRGPHGYPCVFFGVWSRGMTTSFLVSHGIPDNGIHGGRSPPMLSSTYEKLLKDHPTAGAHDAVSEFYAVLPPLSLGCYEENGTELGIVAGRRLHTGA